MTVVPSCARVGMIIPAFFSNKASDATVRELLWMTLADCPHYVYPENILVVVDGDERTRLLAVEAKARMAKEAGAFQILTLPENRGKFWATRVGIQHLLQSPDLEYFVVRDGDGDHLAASIPAMVRAAEHMRAACGHDRLLVIGARSSRHHPMGWLRGELETFLDDVTMDAVRYRLAAEGRVPDLQFCSQTGVPDISSGYKLYGRALAEETFTAEPHVAPLTESDYWHFGPETCSIVEILMADGIIGQIPRLTWHNQPTTSFGEFSLTRLYGELLVWVLVRLDIPVPVAARMIDNRLPAMSANTLAEGVQALERVRTHALKRLGDIRGIEGPIPPWHPALPVL